MAYELDEDRGGQSARRNCRTDGTRPYQSAYHLVNFYIGNAETSYIARIYQANGGTDHVTDDDVHTGGEKS